MKLTFEAIDKERLCVKYVGKISIENAADIGNAIKNKLENVRELIFDFSEVPYISSAGLRMLLDVYKTLQLQKGSVYIKNANADVKNVFDLSGFQGFINVI